jgi:hypothetical protein
MGGVLTMQVDKETPISAQVSDEQADAMRSAEEYLTEGWTKTITVEIRDTLPIEKARYPEIIQLKVKARYVGWSKPRWDKNNWHNEYRITITNLKTKKSLTTRFWDNIVNTDEGRALSDEDIVQVLYIIVEDALSYDELRTMEEFMNEYGYDECEAEKVFKACKRIFESFERIGLNSDALATINRVIFDKESDNKLSELIKEVRTR